MQMRGRTIRHEEEGLAKPFETDRLSPQLNTVSSGISGQSGTQRPLPRYDNRPEQGKAAFRGYILELRPQAWTPEPVVA